MNLIDVLGYINSFVEHQKHKTVILANEAEIVVKDKDGTENGNLRYTQIKEKLVGRERSDTRIYRAHPKRSCT
jgi:hypothetical protein